MTAQRRNRTLRPERSLARFGKADNNPWQVPRAVEGHLSSGPSSGKVAGSERSFNDLRFNLYRVQSAERLLSRPRWALISMPEPCPASQVTIGVPRIRVSAALGQPAAARVSFHGQSELLVADTCIAVTVLGSEADSNSHGSDLRKLARRDAA